MFCGIGNRTIRKIKGDLMLFRSSAAICGALVALAVSVTVARSATSEVQPSAVVDAASGDAIVGAASTYNPFKPGKEEGGPSTASGERYDPSVWTAAIKTSLRRKFGGVQFGARPKYALVEAVGKKVIVKINDVGPLRPGRIIDLNERTMRHFDPSMELGVIPDVTVNATVRRRLDSWACWLNAIPEGGTAQPPGWRKSFILTALPSRVVMA
ncbi:septal ring lytic transglycosylase RlpA family protein [Bradyrhizobium sp. LM2.9]